MTRKHASGRSSGGLQSESGSFELTDLGACSFLDDPHTVPPQPSELVSLSANLRALTEDAAPTCVDSCPPAGDAECHPVPPARGASAFAVARAEAVARAGSRGTGSSSHSPGSANTASGPAVDAIPRRPSAAASVSRDAMLPLHGRNASPPPQSTDRLDAALSELIGGPSQRSAADELRAIYGAVFDPDERAAALANAPRSVTGKLTPVAAQPRKNDFGWDDDETDDGRDAAPQSMILRRPPRRSHVSSDSKLP